VGVSISRSGTTTLTYAWGLGIASNNVAKTYALMKGIELAIEANIRSLIVIGDSRLAVGKMVSKIGSVDYTLDAILDWAKKEGLNFSRISFFHVFQENNQNMDNFANTVVRYLILGIMVCCKYYYYSFRRNMKSYR